MDARTAEQTRLFENRLLKRSRHLKKRFRKASVYSYRLYDRDIPEIPLCLDRYEDTDGCAYLVLYAYERPYKKDEAAEKIWLEAMKKTASHTLNIAPEHIFVKTRRKQKNRQTEAGQYEKYGVDDFYITTIEGGLRFCVNLSAYTDTGLFLDHRILRNRIREEAQNKSVLNLFCYTGSFSVYAAAGGASRIDSVDLSAPYLERASYNFKLNGFINKDRFRFIRSDALNFLRKTKQKWDIIILDPPTFSNSKKTDTVFDINRDWPQAVSLCMHHLNEGGILYFSTNSRTLKFDETFLRALCSFSFNTCDIGAQTIPEDFRNKRIHRCWRIVRN